MIEVTASAGELRGIGLGDVWRMDDTHCAGHHTHVVGPDHFEGVVVQFGQRRGIWADLPRKIFLLFPNSDELRPSQQNAQAL